MSGPVKRQSLSLRRSVTSWTFTHIHTIYIYLYNCLTYLLISKKKTKNNVLSDRIEHTQTLSTHTPVHYQALRVDPRALTQAEETVPDAKRHQHAISPVKSANGRPAMQSFLYLTTRQTADKPKQHDGQYCVAHVNVKHMLVWNHTSESPWMFSPPWFKCIWVGSRWSKSLCSSSTAWRGSWPGLTDVCLSFSFQLLSSPVFRLYSDIPFSYIWTDSM